ncbi:hypothetical protein [Paludibaculum fermentans]|uniref:Lipoprotein n=1 Tax=Paludibaculum fermentans TaxID=1473598 RepID=A0A7S7SKT2_PALFE|nr:hypothetical protein [Paludibaculum fermentans]QOY87756.1 hypothetical protein IRI77_34275 [Paludibaculum fermentans]
MRMVFIGKSAVLCTLAAAFSIAAYGQESGAPAAAPGEAPAAPAVEIDKRVFGVLPNYRVADGNAPFSPITTRQKFVIGAKDSFDKPVFLLAGFYAGLAHLQNSNPSFGQGAKGFGNRYVRSLGDTIIGNFMTEAVFPSLLKEDPRYYMLGQNGKTGKQRFFYALSRVMVTKTDSGGSRFNFSEVLGNGVSVAASNLYYPESRTYSANLSKLALQIGTDAISNVLKEFWPDVKQRMQKKKAAKP